MTLARTSFPDVAHYAFNLEQHLVPDMNSSKEESLRSMGRFQKIAAEEDTVIWLNQDIGQSATFPHSLAHMQRRGLQVV
jgi:hypothetical protein